MSIKMEELEKQMLPKKEIPEFWPGDDVSVHVRIKEKEKERTQLFSGTCIGRKGRGMRETFTVRKVSYGEGVERIFPIYSPNVIKIEVIKTRKKKGIAPRAKLYYLREKK